MDVDSTRPQEAPADALAAALDLRRGNDQATVAVDAPTVQWVVFALGDRSFAFPGAQITEILPLPPIYVLPGCPPAIEGVIDVRGAIWSVLRLGDLLASESGPPTRHAAVLLGRTADLESGLRVDAVEDVLEVAQESLLAAPDHLPEALAGLVSGVFRHCGRPVLALDMGRLFQAWRDGRW